MSETSKNEGMGEAKTIRHLVEELEAADRKVGEMERKVQEIERRHRSEVAIAGRFAFKALVLWVLFHGCLWSWNQQAPQSLGQQAYTYLDAAIRKGLLPSMAQLQAGGAVTAPAPTTPAPSPSK